MVKEHIKYYEPISLYHCGINFIANNFSVDQIKAINFISPEDKQLAIELKADKDIISYSQDSTTKTPIYQIRCNVCNKVIKEDLLECWTEESRYDDDYCTECEKNKVTCAVCDNEMYDSKKYVKCAHLTCNNYMCDRCIEFMCNSCNHVYCYDCSLVDIYNCFKCEYEFCHNCIKSYESPGMEQILICVKCN